MTDDHATNLGLRERVRAALASADVAVFETLLAADATWGAPDDMPSCRNRDEVLAWYRRGYDAGIRAEVTEVIEHGDRLLVGLRVTGNAGPDADGGAERWQVLSVIDEHVVDIRAFDDRVTAAASAGITT